MLVHRRQQIRLHKCHTTPRNKKFYFIRFVWFWGHTWHRTLGKSSSLSCQWQWFTQTIFLLSPLQNYILWRNRENSVPAFPAPVENLCVWSLTYTGWINSKDLLGQVLKFCRGVSTKLWISRMQLCCMWDRTALHLCPSTHNSPSSDPFVHTPTPLDKVKMKEPHLITPKTGIHLIQGTKI